METLLVTTWNVCVKGLVFTAIFLGIEAIFFMLIQKFCRTRTKTLANVFHRPLQVFIGTIWSLMHVHSVGGEDLVIHLDECYIGFFLFWLATRLLRWANDRLLIKYGIDETKNKGLLRCSQIGCLICFGLIIVDYFDLKIASFLKAGGIAGIAIGYVARNMLSDFFSGLFLLLNGPFKIEDEIWLSTPIDLKGKVKHVGPRYMHLELENKEVAVIPNSLVARAIIQR